MDTVTRTLYDTDFNLWIEQTINQLKSGNLRDLDRENLIDEIESMGRSDKREIRSRLIVLLMHLLKYQYQPKKQTRSWISIINTQRNEIELVLKDSPSLRPYVNEDLPECYQKAIRSAVNETNLPLTTFPADCPFSPEQVLDPDYFPK
ncbi:MAG: DUF29 domain-containing protein [Synechocystis sp.]|jgi:hypothetical protein